MSLLNPASTDRANTPANEKRNGASARQFRPEIGLAADSLAGSTGLTPCVISSQTCAAVHSPSEPDGGGSFGKKRRNRGGQPLLVGRPCAHCGTVLTRRDTESRGHFNARRCCSNACASASRTPIPVVLKNCKFCDDLMLQRATEPGSNYRKRKFCDQRCAQACKSREMKRRDSEKNAGNAARRIAWTSWPKPKDRGREAELYAAAGRYDAPGRTVYPPSSGRAGAKPPTYVYSEARS